MSYTFLFEKALDKKGLQESELPKSIQDEIGKLEALNHKLAELPDDEKNPEVKSLNNEIDVIDESIANSIEKINTETPPATTTPATTETDDKSEEGSGAGMLVGGLVILGGLIWIGMKFLGGKK